ncbi:hypothetical protein BD769DRAFT_1575338 [Suillus cothurnatus]|nr:hypothetical protein BD769DRAFT_1575338 [Suillus cothurnatus]
MKQCLSVDPFARPSALIAMDFLKSELETVTDDNVFVGGMQESRRHASLGVIRDDQITVSAPLSNGVQSQAETVGTRTFQSASRILVQSQAIHSNPVVYHPFSTLPLAGPLNVLLFGETGVGKSSIINLIMKQDATQASPNEKICNLEHTSYEVSLGARRFKLWEVSSIESMSFFRAPFFKWRLKEAFKKLYRDEGVYLLLYCMREPRAKRALIRNYKNFTDIVGLSSTAAGHVPVAAVVTSLEDYPTDMDEWWARNEDNLRSLGMRFSTHACITSLPDDPHASPAKRARRQRSEQIIRSLLYNSYQASTEISRSSSSALTP